MDLTKKQKWILLVVLISVFLAVAAGIVFGVLVFLREDVLVAKSRTYYGRIRISKAIGRSLHWTTSLSDKNSTQSIGTRRFLEAHLLESMSGLSRPLSAVTITRFSEDQFARLVRAQDRGVHVTFKIEIQDDQHGPEVENILKDELLALLSSDKRFDLDPESLEIDTKPLIQTRSYEAFETYLSEGEHFDLLKMQLPGVVQPSSSSHVTCPRIQPVSHGSVSPFRCSMSNSSRLGDACTLKCDTNYTIVGFQTLTCLSTGRWSSAQPLCKARCPALPVFMGVKITPAACTEAPSLADTRCFYHCSMGHVLSGAAARICLENGVWSGVSPMCKKTCATLSIPEHGVVRPQSCTSDTLQPAGSLCTYTCNEGFTLAGSPTLLCDMDGSWKFPAPNCRRGCTPLVAPAHGSIFPPLCSRTALTLGQVAVVMEGIVCIHSCEVGFKLLGSKQRMCGAGGSWTGKQAICSKLCPPLKLPKLMSASPHICIDPSGTEDRLEGQKCLITCPDGYRLSDASAVATCSEGAWVGIPPACLRTCPKLSVVTNGMLTPAACNAELPSTEGAKCTVECGVGFMLQGSLSVHCLANGKWSGAVGRCLKQCPPLLPLSHGFLEPVNCTTTAVFQGTVCRYFCHTDYGLSGDETKTCHTDGTWSSGAPICVFETQLMIRQTLDQRDICLDVNTVTNHAEKRQIYQCDLGNRLQRWTVHPEGLIRNVGLRKCLSVEHKHPGSYIGLKECSVFDSNQIWLWEDDNGVSVTLSGTSLVLGYGYASIAKVVLVESSSAAAVPWYAVTSSGSFSLYDLFSEVGCPRLHSPYLVAVTPTICISNQTLQNETECTFSCGTGYKLQGNERRSCINGRWNGTYPTCKLACPAIEVPVGGSVTPGCDTDIQSEGTLCEFQCEPGRLLEGDAGVACMSSGGWTNSPPNCTVKCPAMSEVENGVVFPPECLSQDSSIGEVCQLSCESPYKEKEPRERHCLSTGSWSGGVFTCERGCDIVLSPPGGGEVLCPSENVWHGETCAYMCGSEPHRKLSTTDPDTGEVILLPTPGNTGILLRTCQLNGLFNSFLPVCVSACPPLTAPGNGSISPAHCTSQEMVEGQVCKVLCDLGYGLRGSNAVTCLNSGLWESTTFYCEEENQFFISDTAAPTPVCLYVNTSLEMENSGWYVLKQDFASCDNITSLWTWHGNEQLKHVASGLCMEVLDPNAKRMTALIMRECSLYNPTQQWFCDPRYPGLIHPYIVPIYINIGNSDTDRVVAYRHTDSNLVDVTQHWFGLDPVNPTESKSICALHTHKCPAFTVPEHATAGPEICNSKSLVNISTVCVATCDPGYVYVSMRRSVVHLGCGSDNEWNYTASIVPQCSLPCPAVTPTSGLTIIPENCGAGYATFSDICQFHCDYGYDRIGPKYLICGADGVWSEEPSICSKICPHSPPMLPHPSANQTVYATSENCAFDSDKYGAYIIAGTECRYRCDPPYVPATSLTRTCHLNGSFDAPFPTCHIPKDVVGTPYSTSLCPPPPAHPQAVGRIMEVASCTLPGNIVRLCAWYGCSAGYRIPTDNAIHCLAGTYTWTSPPSCQRRCPPISDECGSMSEGDVCEIECSSGHSLSHGNGRLVCRADGTWTDTMPYCVRKPHFRISTYLPGYNRQYCLFHSSRVGSDPLLQLEDCSLASPFDPDLLWSWDGSGTSLRHQSSSYCLSTASVVHGARLQISECNSIDQLQKWKCSNDPYEPFHVSLQSNDNYIWSAGSAVTGAANDGARLVHVDSIPHIQYGDDTTTRLPFYISWVAVNESDWSQPNVTLCSVRSSSLICNPLASAVPTGGRMMPRACTDGWSPLNQMCTFDCGEGYALGSSSTQVVTCLESGLWSSLDFVCDRACPDLPPIPNMIVSGCDMPVNIVGTICNISCDTDRQLQGCLHRVCQWDGRWSGVEGKCNVPCHTLPVPENSAVFPLECGKYPNMLLSGAVCSYECVEGHQVAGKAGVTKVSRMCFHNGTWSSILPLCVRVCPPQPIIPNGKIMPIICTTGESSAGFVCKVQCDEGYAVHGNDTRVCSESGTWKNSITGDFGPVCRTRCLSPVPTPNSRLVCGDPPLPPNTHYLDGVSCKTICDLGYGIYPNNPPVQLCSKQRWSGSRPKCVKEDQFQLFMMRLFRNGKKVTVCLTLDGKSKFVQKVFSQGCNAASAYQRWSWYNGTKIKNAVTGECLGVESLSTGQKVTTGACNSVNLYNEWSCGAGEGQSWLLHLSGTRLYADYGFAATVFLWMMDTAILDHDKEDVHWYAMPFCDDVALSSPVTPCATRITLGVCPPLVPSQHGHVHPAVCSSNEVTAGLKCLFDCEVGYSLTSKTSTVACQTNGLWSGSTPVCAVICESLDDVPNGRIHPDSCISEHTEGSHSSVSSGVLVGGECAVECDDGWVLVGGPGILTCLGDGNWNSRPPMCKRLCPLLSISANAVASDPSCYTHEKHEGQVCSFRCLSGYGVPRACRTKLNSSALLHPDGKAEYCSDGEKEGYDVEVHLSCTSDGDWSEETPECKPLCPALMLQPHGYLEPLSCVEQPQTVGSVCVYHCNENYTIRGRSSNFTCNDGMWLPSRAVTSADFDINIFDKYIHEAPPCEIYCPPLVVQSVNISLVTPGSCLTSRNAIATVCQIECQSDFVLKGELSVTCQEDGTWDTTLGTCIKKCPALVAPPNGEIRPLACSTASMGDGAVCSYVCSDKYALDGPPTVSCNGSGIWSGGLATCKRRCQPITRFYNGYASPVSSCFTEHITSGEACHFTCADNFLLIGPNQITCLEIGEWDHSTPTCHRICDWPKVEHGNLTCNYHNEHVDPPTTLTWGTTCRVQCMRNYALTHNAAFSCDNEGQWTPGVPQCIETGVPMYILQTLGHFSVCLVERSSTRLVVKLSQSQCLIHTNYASNTSWNWLGSYNIQNSQSGYCMAVRSAVEGEKLRTAPCNTDDALQHWDCSVDNAFQVVLRDTHLAPSTFYMDVESVVLQSWSDAHSYFSTFDLITLSSSSICSRRPGGICPPLHNIVDGKIEPFECQSDNVVAGQQCSYECEDELAYLSGSTYTICMGNGLWSSPPPECIKSCGPLSDLPSLPDGTYYTEAECIFDASPIGRSCDALCMSGYEMVGNATRECLATGSWSPAKYKCERTCPSIFGLLHGIVEPIPCRSGECKFTCRPGYVLVGADSYSVHCLDDGKWDNILPKCIRDPQFQIILLEPNSQVEMCLTVPPGATGAMLKSICSRVEAYDGSQLFKWSESGAVIVNPASGMCLRGNFEKWGNVTMETCWELENQQQWDCGSHPGVHDNALRLQDTTYFLDFGCSLDGYSSSVEGDSPLREVVMETDYFMTSQWIARHYYGQGTVCSMRKTRQCPPFQSIANSVVSPTTCLTHSAIVKGLVCQVKCDSGYTQLHTDRSVCLNDGTWSTPIPVCTGIYQCPELPPLDQMLMVEPSLCTGASVTEGVVCSFKCADNYKLQGQQTIQCRTAGVWSWVPPSCTSLCEGIPYVSRVTVWPLSCHAPNNNPGTTCSVSCEPMFRMIGSEKRTCKDNGLWSGTDAMCVVYCSALSLPSSGNVYPDRCKLSENFEGNSCNFRCNDGFVLIGNSEVICTNGSWDRESPQCVSMSFCARINVESVGIKEVIYQYLVKDIAIGNGTQVTVVCVDGFILHGPQVRTCLNNGQWEHGNPYCVATCAPVLPPNHGSVLPAECGWMRQNVESGCLIRCDVGWVIQGSHALQCLGNGEWSDKLPSCTGGSYTDPKTKPFIIRQIHSGSTTSICLKANSITKLVEADSDCQTTYHQWRWRDLSVGLIESMGQEGYCWTPARHDTRIRLALAPCDPANPSQSFECSDASLRQRALQVSAEGLALGRDSDAFHHDKHVYLLSRPGSFSMDWEALEPGPALMVNMSYDNSLCRKICGGLIESFEGTITSPGYPIKYPKNTICRWIIKAPNRVIRFWVMEVDLARGRDHMICDRDVLMIMEGDSFTDDSYHALATLCGSLKGTQGPITSLHGSLLIEFRSGNHDITLRGFNARWTTEPFPASKTECASTTSSPPVVSDGGVGRLVGGVKESVEKVPWHAAVFSNDVGTHGDDESPLCGATVIGQSYAMTSAHCLDYVTTQNQVSSIVLGYGSSELWRLTRLSHLLREGDGNIMSLDDATGATVRRLGHIYIHPTYDENMEHDIALVKVMEPIVWSAKVIPACLPPAEPSLDHVGHGRVHLPKQYCKLAGWGSEADGGDYVGHLASIEIPVMTDQKCAHTSASIFGRRVDTRSTLCAGHFDGTRQSPCKGDGGGGLTCQWNGNYYLVGVAGQQIGECSVLNVPRYFARVSQHVRWIEDTITKSDAGYPSSFGRSVRDW